MKQGDVLTRSINIDIGGASRRVVYTDTQAYGAIPNGSLVRKINSAPGDIHTDGAFAILVGSVRLSAARDRYFYSVVWEDMPGMPAHITDSCIEVVK